MGYKRFDELSFADLAVEGILRHSRSYKMMEKIDRVINWDNIEALLYEYYEVGKRKEGADAYPPLMLLKALLLQKWFRIKSDPELENQINDRISFKRFLGLPLDRPSPDHSTFSRFRSRLGKWALMKINSEVLRQFGKRGFSIDEGIAVDARLVRSASKPISKDELEEERGKREGGGSGSKFSRDIDSDWTITKDGEPHFGLKEHVAVDVKDGFVLATNITKASEHESRYLPYIVLASCHTGNKISRVYGDKGYRAPWNNEGRVMEL